MADIANSSTAKKIIKLLKLVEDFKNSNDPVEAFSIMAKIALDDIVELSTNTEAQEKPTVKWLVDVIYENPTDSVKLYRSRTSGIQKLQKDISILSKDTSILLHWRNLKQYSPLTSEVAKIVATEEYENSIMLKAFTYDCAAPDFLNAACIYFFSKQILALTRNKNVGHCIECQSLFFKIKRQTYCTENCRTIANNKKRDPNTHNENEKRSRKQRIVHANKRKKIITH